MGSLLSSLLYRIEAAVAAHKYPPAPVAQRLAVSADAAWDAAAPSFDHSAWDRALKRHVSPGGAVGGVRCAVVDYAALAADPDVDAYRAALAAADVDALPPNEQLALWMNAYNALCVGHVVRHMAAHGGARPASVVDAKVGKLDVWDADAGVVGGRAVTLTHVEHAVLRSRWAEPRVHACINCASASCPDLRAEAFDARRLNAQMSEQAARWMADDTKGARRGEEGRVLTLSRVLLWFAPDFAPAGGAVAWAQQHAPTTASTSSTARVDYFEYNWSLNDKSA